MTRDAEACAVAEFENMIRSIARKFPASAVLGWDDLMQHGRIGAIKAHRTFRADRASRSQWFYYHIKGEMVDALRAVNHIKTIAGEPAGHGSHVIGFVEATPAIPSGGDFRREVETRLDAATLMAKILTPRSASIIRHRFLDGLSLAETGARIGTCGSNVLRIERAALAHLRRAA